MTAKEWKLLGPHLKRADLRAVGFKDHVIDDLRFPVDTPSAKVPPGRIGAMRGLTGTSKKRKGQSQWTYLKWTVNLLLGPGYE